nr:Peptidase C1A domain containing protein [Haemonchus contortus]
MQKYLVFALYLLLCRTLGTDVDDAQKILPEEQMLSGEPLVDYLRKNQDLFEVRISPTPGFKQKLMDMKFRSRNISPIVIDDNDSGDDIPEDYDLRTIWKNCSSFFIISDQANCASGWAVSTAAAISDRICLATKGEKQVYISAADILSCCGSACNDGCEGGDHVSAWEFFESEGVVSGGPYLGKGCCRPYPFHPCGHHGNDTYYGECPETAVIPKCTRKCQPGFRKIYRTDKEHGVSGGTYTLPNSVKAIQRDIMRRGPVTATFDVYEDFSHYQSGIYKHTAGSEQGRHAVKIIGWGNENGTNYWIIANSWHNDWGENGFFRMIRGINDCDIEDEVAGGIVDVDRL